MESFAQRYYDAASDERLAERKKADWEEAKLLLSSLGNEIVQKIEKADRKDTFVGTTFEAMEEFPSRRAREILFEQTNAQIKTMLGFDESDAKVDVRIRSVGAGFPNAIRLTIERLA